MLIRFITGNFLSFKEETEFNMLPAASQKHHKDHIYDVDDISLLKTAIIYGANGAGKSNFIKAISFLKKVIVGKSKISDVKKYKLEPQYLNKPTIFEIEFIKNNVSYLYSLSIDSDSIIEESLFKSGNGINDDDIIFERKLEDGDIQIRVSDQYKKTDRDQNYLDFIKNNLLNNKTLMLTAIANLKEDGYTEIKNVFSWFKRDLITIFPRSKYNGIVPHILESDDFRKFAHESLCSFSTGIHDIEINTIPAKDFFGKNDEKLYEDIVKELESAESNYVGINEKNNPEQLIVTNENGESVVKRLISKHANSQGELIDFFLPEESDGTNRLLDLIPAMFFFLTRESVIIIDEIDQSLHPVLLKEIIRKVISDSQTKGQFIFSTHEANLLDQDIFRRDEIWFAEKDKGETKIYPLSDYDIRFDLDIRKGYLNGRFGAIPFIGNLRDLNWDKYATKEPTV